MTVAELRYGALNSRDPDGDTARVEAFLAPIEVLSFDRDAARRHAELRYALRHQPIGERDLVIASVAVARQLTLVTRNQREFGRIAELSLEDWTEA